VFSVPPLPPVHVTHYTVVLHPTPSLLLFRLVCSNLGLNSTCGSHAVTPHDDRTISGGCASSSPGPRPRKNYNPSPPTYFIARKNISFVL
jgi:hypothetical protein